MLKKLNTNYFLKIVFSFMDERQKLKIVKYNKTLQKIIDRNLINYLVFINEYVVYESDRKGREYNRYSNLLVFEVEYLNGERNWKGKEYDHRGIYYL